MWWILFWITVWHLFGIVLDLVLRPIDLLPRAIWAQNLMCFIFVPIIAVWYFLKWNFGDSRPPNSPFTYDLVADPGFSGASISSELVETYRLREVQELIAVAEREGISVGNLSMLANDYATGIVMMKRIKSYNRELFNDDYEPTYTAFFEKHKHLIKHDR